jgi:hypothetical protein
MSQVLIEGEDSDAQGRYCRRYDRFGFWTASPSNARAPSLSQRVDPHQMRMTASAMPVTEFADYSFVFVH